MTIFDECCAVVTTFGISRHDVLVWIASLRHISLVNHFHSSRADLVSVVSPKMLLRIPVHGLGPPITQNDGHIRGSHFTNLWASTAVLFVQLLKAMVRQEEWSRGLTNAQSIMHIVFQLCYVLSFHSTVV